jgi:Glycosyl transferase family 11
VGTRARGALDAMSIRVVLQGGLGNQLFQILKALELGYDGEGVAVDVTLLHGPSRRLAGACVSTRTFECELLAAKLGWRVQRIAMIPPDAYRRLANFIADRAPSIRFGPMTLITGPSIHRNRRSSAEKILAESIAQLYRLPTEPINRQSVHLRLGDYRQLEHIYGPPDMHYYRTAMNMAFTSNMPVAVFSDEILEALAWFRERFTDFEFRPANSFEWPIFRDSASWNDLLRMAISNRLVAANSTYSWWSTWLGQKCFGGCQPLHTAPLRMHPTGLQAPTGVIGISWRIGD